VAPVGGGPAEGGPLVGGPVVGGLAVGGPVVGGLAVGGPVVGGPVRGRPVAVVPTVAAAVAAPAGPDPPVARPVSAPAAATATASTTRASAHASTGDHRVTGPGAARRRQRPSMPPGWPGVGGGAGPTCGPCGQPPGLWMAGDRAGSRRRAGAYTRRRTSRGPRGDFARLRSGPWSGSGDRAVLSGAPRGPAADAAPGRGRRPAAPATTALRGPRRSPRRTQRGEHRPWPSSP
jgi:hypothetical protein